MPSVPNPPGTPNSAQLNPLTPASPPAPASSTPNTITPQRVPLKDWQAALGTYVVLLWTAEIPSLAPFAVAIAWGTAIIYTIATNVPKRLAEAVQKQNGGQASQQSQAQLGEIVGNAAEAQRIGR